MVYMVDGVRYGMIDVTKINPNVSLAVLTGVAVGGFSAQPRAV
jgi:ABC-2 type transport system permease protein